MIKKLIIKIIDPIFQLINDRTFLKIIYRYNFKKKLNLEQPKTFNEKLQWLKLYNRKPEYTKMVDKYEVKSYVAEKIGKEYIIPTLGIWEKFEEIDFEKLPNQFVLKCTHDSGSIVICKDKSKFNKKEAQKKLNKSLKNNYFYAGREWPYKNVKPRIIAEKYMEDESKTELKDYKIFNFNGIPKMIQVDFNRFSGHKRNIYTDEWNLIDVELLYPMHKEIQIKKPENLDKMFEFAKILSKDIPFLRTDFYVINDKIYFGELTFFPESGCGKFKPEKYDECLGRMLELPKEKDK